MLRTFHNRDRSKEGEAYWQEVSNSNSPGAEPYETGLEALNDRNIQRHPKNSKNISKEFNATIGTDPWKSKLPQTQSLRSLAHIQTSFEAMGVNVVPKSKLRLDSKRNTVANVVLPKVHEQINIHEEFNVDS